MTIVAKRFAICLAMVLALSPVACTNPVENTTFQTVVPSEPIEAEENIAVSETSAEHAYTNRLIDQTSPYLLQHAHNPVDWYAWGEAAFAKARAEDKPIFLSVGYSSCHWCHVMERESFEKEDVAAILNAHFVSIKVDREERPDVDEIYMTAVQAMTGHGGWPMSVFLTPELEPFYGGTYFPPEARFGRPGFKSLLNQIATSWIQKRKEINESAGRLASRMKGMLTQVSGKPSPLKQQLLDLAVDQLRSSFDSTDGGFGPAPKFPSSASIALLLRNYKRSGDGYSLKMAVTTLDKMMGGGMYDHLGGGFARYSTDDEWLVPHFEKMLYDNGQLAQIYLEAYQLTGDERYKRVVEETLEYVLRDMRDAGGAFHSAEDADSEGEEGKFYLWRYKDIISHLGKEDGKIFAAYYNLKSGGNFNSVEHYHAGLNILHTPRSLDAVAKDLGLDPEALDKKLGELRARLLHIRSKRVRPGLDDKVLTSWNALMISAFAQSAQVLHSDRYRDAAVEAATFIITAMMKDGELLRTHRAGESHLAAYLDDYAFLIAALTDVYEATFDLEWLERADDLTQTMIKKFWDPQSHGFYFTSAEHTNLIVRTRPTYDGAVPSGNSVAAYALLRLAKFLDNADYYEKAKRILESNYQAMARVPTGYLKMLVATDFFLHPPQEIAIAGPRESEGVQSLLDTLHGAYIPNKVLAWVDPSDPQAERLGERLPLLQGKTLISGKPAAYVCRNYACKLPVTTPAEFRVQLGLKMGEV